MEALNDIHCPPDKLQASYENLVSCKLDTGVTYSNYDLRESVMVISRTSSYYEFSNSLKHETRHLEDHIAIANNMQMGGEEVAYLSGYIGKVLAKDIRMFICDCNCHEKEIEEKLLCNCKNNNYDYED